jgi:hypothetical protein
MVFLVNVHFTHTCSLLFCQVVDIDAQLHLRVHPPVPTQMNSKPLLLLLPSRVPSQALCVLSASVGIRGDVHDKLEKYISFHGRGEFGISLP